MSITQASGSLTAANDTVALTVTGEGVTLVNIAGTYTGLSVILQATADGTNWYNIVGYRTNTSAKDQGTISLSAANRSWFLSAGLFTKVRVKCSAISTGTATVVIQTGLAMDLPAVPAAVLQHRAQNVGDVTVNAAAGTTGANSVLVASGPGILHSVKYNGAGTASLILYDNATTNSGKILYSSAATVAAGATQDLNIVFSNGVTLRKANGTAAISVNYKLL